MSNYAKLKTNLKLAIQRLKLLEKKKSELSLKSRKEIADYLSINKPDRARIRVEHIIREDNYVEAMELLEMFCDLLLARFGLIEKMKELDPGLDEAIATVIWSAPRISNDIQEFKTIGDLLAAKYGKNYAEACKLDKARNVNEKVKKRLGVEPPSRLLVEQYLIEIAKNFNVKYLPDAAVMLQSSEVNDLINLDNNENNNNNGAGGFSPGPGGFSAGGGGSAAGGFSPGPGGFSPGPGGFSAGGYNIGGGSGGGGGGFVSPGFGFNQTPNNQNDFNYPQKTGPNSKSQIGSNSNEIIMPVLPPPLPSSFPEGDDLANNLPEYRKSLPPPYVYADQNNNNAPFDLSDPINIKRALNGPVVVSDPNAPLPYKPGMNDVSPPPNYQEKKPPYANKNLMPQPTAPVRGTSAKSNRNFDDLPSVPDYTPTNDDKNNGGNADDDDDVSFDDLQKRFNNLKNN